MEILKKIIKEADILNLQYQRMSGNNMEQLNKRLAIANKASLLYTKACKLQKQEL